MTDRVTATPGRRRWYRIYVRCLVGIFVLIVGVFGLAAGHAGWQALGVAAGWSGEAGTFTVSSCTYKSSRTRDYDCRGEFRPDDRGGSVREGVLLDDGNGVEEGSTLRVRHLAGTDEALEPSGWDAGVQLGFGLVLMSVVVAAGCGMIGSLRRGAVDPEAPPPGGSAWTAAALLAVPAAIVVAVVSAVAIGIALG